MTDELGLAEYDRAVVEHALFGRCRARMFQAAVDTRTWEVSLDVAQIGFDGITFGAQLLGTYSSVTDTFSWGWANPAAAEWTAALAVANQLRDRGARPGNAVFREPKIAAGWVNPFELAWVAGELAGGLPIFVAEHDHGSAIVAVTGLPIDPAELEPTYIPGVIADMHRHIAADARACVRRFAERLGFAVDGTDELRAQRYDAGFIATFDASGHPARVKLDAAGR